MFLARQARVSQKATQRIAKYLPTKNGTGQEEIGGAACPRWRQQKETSLLPVNRAVRSVAGTWLVFTCRGRLRTTPPSPNLREGCTYLPDPGADLGEGESTKESLAFPIDAAKCSRVVCSG